MAKRSKRSDSSIDTISRGSQKLLGLGIAIVGAIMVLMVLLVVQGSGEDYNRALKEQSFVQARCVVESASRVIWRDADGDQHPHLTVTFKLQVGAATYSGLSYSYPEYAYNNVPSEQQVQRDFAPGAPITCFYDRETPTDAVLMKKTMPQEEPPNPLWGWMFGAIGVLICVAGVYMAHSDKEWKLYSQDHND